MSHISSYFVDNLSYKICYFYNFLPFFLLLWKKPQNYIHFLLEDKLQPRYFFVSHFENHNNHLYDWNNLLLLNTKKKSSCKIYFFPWNLMTKIFWNAQNASEWQVEISTCPNCYNLGREGGELFGLKFLFLISNKFLFQNLRKELRAYVLSCVRV